MHARVGTFVRAEMRRQRKIEHSKIVFHEELFLYVLLDYLLISSRNFAIAGQGSSSLFLRRRAGRREHGSVSPAHSDAGQAVAEHVGRDEEEEGGGQRRAEEERHHVAALLPSKPQTHVCFFQTSHAIATRTAEMRSCTPNVTLVSGYI
jgi:hypothetical protein